MRTLIDPGSEVSERDSRIGQSDALWSEEALAFLVHDLRSPLASIQQALYGLRLVHAVDAPVDRALGVIERQTAYLSGLVGDLLDLSRLQAGKLQLLKRDLDLRTVVAHAADVCRPLLDQRGHHFTVALPPDPVQLRADPTRLQQILANLLANAAKYTNQRGQIWLTAEVADVLVLRVRDNGIGIAPEMRSMIFNLFQQGRGDGKRGGLGVGLALVKWLVELHGGSIAAYSEGLGRGSEFVIRLPGLSTPAPRMEPPALAPPQQLWAEQADERGAT